MTTASEIDEKNVTPYVFVSGDAGQEHQDEINRFASKGYRVIGMSQQRLQRVDGPVFQHLWSRRSQPAGVLVERLAIAELDPDLGKMRQRRRE